MVMTVTTVTDDDKVPPPIRRRWARGLCAQRIPRCLFATMARRIYFPQGMQRSSWKRPVVRKYKRNPFGGSSYAKGIAVEKIGIEARKIQKRLQEQEATAKRQEEEQREQMIKDVEVKVLTCMDVEAWLGKACPRRGEDAEIMRLTHDEVELFLSGLGLN